MGGTMEAKDVFTLGLGLSAPWKLASQRLDMEKQPRYFELTRSAPSAAGRVMFSPNGVR